MTTKKIAISLPEAILARAKAAVKNGKADNLSRLIAKSLDETTARESFAEMISAFRRESGLTEPEIAKGRARAKAAFDRWDKEKKNEKAPRKAG